MLIITLLTVTAVIAAPSLVVATAAPGGAAVSSDVSAPPNGDISEPTPDEILAEHMNAAQRAWEDANPTGDFPDWQDRVTVVPTEEGFEVSLDAELENSLLAELEASSLPRTTVEDGDMLVTTYSISEDFDFTVEQPLIAPMLSGGYGTYGIYIQFNSLDQDLILNGSGILLTAAICAIPAVGAVLCTVVGAVISTALIFFRHNGTCPRSLRIYPFADVKHCVNS
ncbi:MAG: hypothetical protein HOV76_12430 [Hamadaea sp.]|nr:hypothetical protein [Hamadaea sp.]